jgi:hypothetical protein
MERKVYDCDDCDRKGLIEIARITVETRRYMDAAGSMDTDVEYADLCIICLRKHLMKFLEKFNYDEGKKWADSLKHK